MTTASSTVTAGLVMASIVVELSYSSCQTRAKEVTYVLNVVTFVYSIRFI